MDSGPGLLVKLQEIIFDAWSFIFMSMVGLLLWIGKRQYNRFDEMSQTYVSEKAMEAKHQEIQERMLKDQQELIRQIAAVHRRMDTLFTILLQQQGTDPKIIKLLTEDSHNG